MFFSLMSTDRTACAVLPQETQERGGKRDVGGKMLRACVLGVCETEGILFGGGGLFASFFFVCDVL